MANISIIFTDANGTGIPDQDIHLRKGPTYSAPAYVFSNVTGKPGAYETADQPATGIYKLWVNGSEDESYGEREITAQDDLIIKITDVSGTYFEGRGLEIRSIADPTEPQSAVTKAFADDNYLNIAGGTMSGNIDMDGNFIKNLPAPEDDGDAARNVDVTDGDAAVAGAAAAAIAAVDAAKADKTGGNTFVGNQVFENDVAFSEDPPTCGNDPVNDDSLTRKAWVQARIDEVDVTPGQYSINEIDLMPGGVQQTGKVYTNWQLTQNYCRLLPASNAHRFQINIKGAGSGGTSITATDGAISGNKAFNSYVSMKGPNRRLRVLVDDDTFTVTAGSVVLQKFTLARDDDGDGTPIFENFDFEDMDFDFDVAGLSFNGCTFKGVCNIKNTGSVAFSSCKGGTVYCTDAIPASLRGEGDVPAADLF